MTDRFCGLDLQQTASGSKLGDIDKTLRTGFGGRTQLCKADHKPDAAGYDTWDATGIRQLNDRNEECRVGRGSTWSSGVGGAGDPGLIDASPEGDHRRRCQGTLFICE